MSRPTLVTVGLLMYLCALPPGLQGQDVEVVGDSVQFRFVNTDVRAAIQAFGRFLPKPVVVGDLGGVRVELFETPGPVARGDLPSLLRGLATTNGLLFAEDSTLYRVTRVNRDASRGGPVTDGQSGEALEAITLRLFTVRLKHARAGDVAATLNQLYGVQTATSSPDRLSAGRLSDELRRDRTGAGSNAEATQPEPEGAALRQAVTIVPDDLTNSLLIRSTQEDFDVLQEGIAQLDVRPLQVLIEVVVVEARKDRQFALGFDVDVPSEPLEEGTIEGTLTGAGLGDLVVKVMGLTKLDVNATLTAARQRGDVEIHSRPVLIASNNTESQLLVGTQQPFISVSRSLPTETPQRDQVVQYRDVGTKLVILPTINQDGYVSLLLQQEISSATGETQFGAPVISSREATTQVLVADGQTIVVGGLRDKVHDEVRTGIPVLADIPLIGGLFGGTRTRTTETELFLFITPTIIATDADAEAATQERMTEGMRNKERGG